MSTHLNSALTRFVNQGLARGGCALCHVAHKVEREFIWHFFDDYSGQAWALDELRHARGFCAVHAGMLRATEVDGLKSTLGISGTYLDALEGLSAQLRALDGGGALPQRAPCPACRYRDEEVGKNVGYLLELLADDGRPRERFEASEGLCIGHFELVWPDADPVQRQLLLATDHEGRTVSDAEVIRVIVEIPKGRQVPDPRAARDRAAAAAEAREVTAWRPRDAGA